MPYSCRKAPQGALKLDVEDDDFLLEEIHCHEVLEHDEYDTDSDLSDDDEDDE